MQSGTRDREYTASVLKPRKHGNVLYYERVAITTFIVHSPKRVRTTLMQYGRSKSTSN